jgi:hypothetical protein
MLREDHGTGKTNEKSSFLWIINCSRDETIIKTNSEERKKRGKTKGQLKEGIHKINVIN